MPDEAQTPEPTQRRTAMQVAQDAQATAEAALQLAQTIDESNRQVPEQLSSAVEGLQEKFTDLDRRLRDLPQLPELPELPAMPDLSEFATIARLEELDSRTGAALAEIQPLAEAHNILVTRVDATEATLKAATEETGGYMGAINRKLDDLRTRVAELEKLGPDSEDVKAAAENLGRNVQEQVRRELDGLLARLEALETRPADGGSNVGLTWDAIAERVTNQAKIEVQKHLALVAPGGVPGTAAKPRGVQAKVLKLMRNVDHIAKTRQTAKNAGDYKFRGIDEAMDAVGHAMRDIGLIGSPQIRSVEYDTNVSNNSQGRPILWTTARVVGAYVFTDPEDGSTHPIEIVGEGRDNSDKATSKASSMALKYGLLHGLMIPVTGMPDGDAENPQVFRDPEETARQQAQPPAQQAQQASPQERAQRAVAAFQGLDQIDPGPEGQERYNRFVTMNNLARSEGLMDVEVEWKGQRAPLHYFVTAVQRLLFGAGDGQPVAPAGDSQGGYDDEPPWDGGH